MIDLRLAHKARAEHNTNVFNSKLNPIKPKTGQWFCEFDLSFAADKVVAGQLVEYVGDDLYCIDGDPDTARYSNAFLLILQNKD